jgi:mRNA-degrading endonuclease YafQ of YafQ-DinJ toxin-antitoxin module
LFTLLENDFNDGKAYQLHYMTAREMYNVVKALEEGGRGSPARYRDHALVSNISKTSG